MEKCTEAATRYCIFILLSIKFKLLKCACLSAWLSACIKNVHVSKAKGMHQMSRQTTTTPCACVRHMHEGPSFCLHPPCYDPHSGTVCLALCGHHFNAPPCFLLFAFCFPRLIVFLSGMPALTLSTGDLSVLKIIGKCHHWFSSAHLPHMRKTLPPFHA